MNQSLNFYRENLISCISDYLEHYYSVREDDAKEKIIAGVLAFIAIQEFGEPYVPLIGVEHYEEPKKWWEFWK